MKNTITSFPLLLSSNAANSFLHKILLILFCTHVLLSHFAISISYVMLHHNALSFLYLFLFYLHLIFDVCYARDFYYVM